MGCQLPTFRLPKTKIRVLVQPFCKVTYTECNFLRNPPVHLFIATKLERDVFPLINSITDTTIVNIKWNAVENHQVVFFQVTLCTCYFIKSIVNKHTNRTTILNLMAVTEDSPLLNNCYFQFSYSEYKCRDEYNF